MIEVNNTNKQYNIYIKQQSLSNVEEFLDLSKFSSVVILTDKNIIRNNWLEKLSIKTKTIVIEPGEKYKNLDTVSHIWEQMLSYGMDRKSLLVNIGGGVICDLGGFCASTYMRGIEFIQIPTTLLSQVDASVGGKTGFDFNGYKNIIGSFCSPYLVLIDSNTLSTLPEREYISGMAEVIKYGVIYNEDFFNYLERNKLNNDYIINESCKIKANIISKDFREDGLRKILNCGHTIGHAIESLSLKTNNALLHGEAIAIGIIGEANIAKEIGLISDFEYTRIKNVIMSFDLPISYNGNLDEIYSMLFKDKKNVNKKIKWVLPKHIGNYVFDVEVEENIIKNAIRSILK